MHYKNMNEQNKVLNIIDMITITFGKGIQNTIANTGISFLPILSGFMFAIVIYTNLYIYTNNVTVGLFGAFVGGIGLESVGFQSAKLMVRKPHFLTVAIFIFYIFIGGFSIWFINEENAIPVITTIAFLLTALSYILYSVEKNEEKLSATMGYKEEVETNKEQLAYDRKQAEKQTRFENKLTVEKLKGLGKENATNVSKNVSSVSGNVSYKTLTQEMKEELKGKTATEIQEIYPNLKKRTAYNWVTNLKEDK